MKHTNSRANGLWSPRGYLITPAATFRFQASKLVFVKVSLSGKQKELTFIEHLCAGNTKWFIYIV